MSETTPCSDAETGDAPPPEFIPVSGLRARHDGWTIERQQHFIAGLHRTGTVASAAALAGMTPKSAYRLRLHPNAESFAAAWDSALDAARMRALDAAMDLALGQNIVTRFYRGRFVGTYRGFDNRMLLAALRAVTVIAPGKRGKGHE